MSLSVAIFQGKTCSLPEGCYINGLTPESDWQRFESNSYYLMLDGDAEMTYLSNNTPFTLTSPYGNDWTSYIDQWIYNDEFKIKVSPSTIFCQVKATDASNNAVQASIQVAKVENGNLTKEVKANSTLFVCGENFKYNNTEQKNNPSNTVNIFVRDAGTISLDATSKCVCLLIEPV